MKRKLLLLVACMMAITLSAQTDDQNFGTDIIDHSEDTTEITTVDNIIKMQQEIYGRNSSVDHFIDVWGRRSYFNISYDNTTIKPEETIGTGVPEINGGRVPEFKSNWGVSLQLGRSYRLHKKAIANMVQFNIDYTYIDLSVNHFTAEGDGKKNLYDSREIYNPDNNQEELYHTPWNLEKYEACYSMTLGPSITIAPFNLANSRGLHYMKLNAYYHIGYGVSGILMPNKKEADKNTDEGNARYEKMSKNLKLDWGHGLTQSFGISLSWKVIGIGYERYWSALKYTPVTTDDFGDKTYKFSRFSNRVYIQFRM